MVTKRGKKGKRNGCRMDMQKELKRNTKKGGKKIKEERGEG
jgi:hypothetical protein